MLFGRYNERNSAAVEVLHNNSLNKGGRYLMEVYGFPAKVMLLENGRELTVRAGKQVL